MLIVPEIQISEGRVVTRVSPEADNIVHDKDPVTAVREFEEQGAERIHILDVDAALGRERTNAALIRRIITGTPVPIQVAGGMRTMSHVEEWLQAGAHNVVLGTLAITNQPLLAEACAYHPSAILANVATKGGYVMIDGWQTQTAYRPQDIVYDLQMAGAAGIIHFDIDRREGDASTSLALTMEMKANVVIPVYSSGTVHSLEDIARLRHLPNIHGAIVGEALLNGSFTLAEALEVAGQRYENPEPETESVLAADGIHSTVKVYLAGYNLSPAARRWNQDLRLAITDDSPYVEVFIPQEDLDVDPGSLSGRELQAAYEKVVDDADVVAVVLDGVSSEAWTGFECGYARARGKYLLGIATRDGLGKGSRFEAMCDDMVVFDPAEDWHQTLAEVAREVNARLLEADEAAA